MWSTCNMGSYWRQISILPCCPSTDLRAGRPKVPDLLAAKILSRLLYRRAMGVRARQLVDIAIYRLVLAQRAPTLKKWRHGPRLSRTAGRRFEGPS
jgi:hypothetical protein